MHRFFQTITLSVDDIQLRNCLFSGIRNLLVFLFLLYAFASEAQKTSTFDTDDDGWSAEQIGGTIASSTYQSAGGNPGGNVSVAPPTSGGTVNTSFTWYWVAPSKFLGNYDLYYGSNIKFDLQQSVAGTDNTQSDIIITSGGNSLHFSFPNKPAVSPAWTPYSIILDETAGWHWGSIGGALALKAQIKIVLANITAVRIRCKYINSAGYISSIDNVTVESRTLDTPPAMTSFTPLKALRGESVTITGTNFGATPADNFVYFGNVRADITSAGGNQIVATVPSGATLAPLSIINKTTGLVASSPQDFLPLSINDPDLIGSIIPSSFATNVLVPYADYNDNGLAGAELGDIDGDGLLDIVAFEDPGKFAIFLNQGHTGNITTTSFAPKVEIPSGELGQGNSSSTLLADFDNDGKLDIATFFRGVIPSLSGGFAVSRNISTPGNVQFETAEQFYNIGIFCSGLATADLDGDGLLDFLINSSMLYYARNISTPGNIEFANLRSLNSSVGAITTKDLNGDGKPEIMVTGSGNFTLLENLSIPDNIQFATPVVFPGSVVSGVTLADLDNDTKADILYYRINGFNNYDLVIKKNIHTSGVLSLTSFDNDIILSKVGRAYSQRVADLNGDGKVDILLGLNSGSTGYGFGVFESNVTTGILNTSSFMPIVEFEETSNGVFTIPLIGDLDGDNLQDVVGFASSDGGEHALILYKNLTTSAPRISVNTITPLAAPIGSTVTITGNKFSTDVTKTSVWFGGVKATVLSATKTSITAEVPKGASYDRVSVTRDFLTSRYHLPFVPTFSAGIIFDNTSFSAPVGFSLTGADYDIDVADLDGDGKPEIVAESRVVTGIIRNYAWSYKNIHSAGAITTSSFMIADTTNESALNLRLVDIDHDDKPDILSQQALFRNTSTSADILFDTNVNGAGGGNQSWADFDLDGKTDVIAANTAGASLQVYRNVSKPGPFRTGAFATFDAAINLTKPALGGGTATGDFDNDGLFDFVSTNPGTDNMRVWRNTGGFPLSAAQFTVVGDIVTGDNPGRIYPGDFDRDGKTDLLIYHGTGTTPTLLIVFQNISTIGNIAFNRIDMTNPSATTVATIADLDGDGKPEILTTSETGNRFSIFKNIHTAGQLTAASFAAPFNTTVTAPRGITAGDLNLDGKPEIIITRAANLLVVYENLIPAISIAITQQPVTPLNACEGSTSSLSTDASGTTNITYQWQKFNSGTSLFENLVNNTTYSGVTTKTLSIANITSAEGGDYRCLLKGDLVADVTTNVSNVVFNNLPSPPDAVSSTSCGPGSVTLTASGGSPGDYQWYTTSPLTLISGETNETYTTPVLSASIQYAVSVSGTFCKSLPANVTALVNPIPAKPAITSSIVAVGNEITICSTTTLTLSAPMGFTDYLWSDGSITPQISVTTAGTYSVVVKDAQGCSSSASDGLTVTIVAAPCNNSAPVINTTSVTTTIGGQTYINLLDLISDVDNNLVPSSLIVIVQPTSGAKTTITNGILLIDYAGINFTGIDQLTIQVCDVFGECTQQQIEVEVIGNIEIYNAVSPNNDNKNDIFFIQYIDLIPETQNNKVTIYNRWGSKVFEVANYNNDDRVFKGLNDNGNELPSGTYFYKIVFTESQKKSITGYLELKK